MLHANELAMNDDNIICVSSAHSCAPLCHLISLTKYKLKVKLLNIFKGNSRAINHVWAPFDTRAMCDRTGHTPKNLKDEEP